MKKAKKGFTLIELMIVLAVIAILAIVLIPKIGSTKNSAKAAGVTQNVNSVVGFLQTKIDSYTADGAAFPANSDLKTTLTNNYASDNIKNPFSSQTTVLDDTDSISKAPAVYICSANPDLTTVEGSVVVVVDSANKTFTVYGVDASGSKTGANNVVK